MNANDKEAIEPLLLEDQSREFDQELSHEGIRTLGVKVKRRLFKATVLPSNQQTGELDIRIGLQLRQEELMELINPRLRDSNEKSR